MKRRKLYLGLLVGVFLVVLVFILMNNIFTSNGGNQELVLSDINNIGDINSDGKINSLDYILIRKYLMKLTSFTDNQKKLADTNSDGKVNSLDYIIVRKSILSRTKITPNSSSEQENSETINITNLSINKTSLTLDVGKSETLTAVITPSNATDKTLTWSSSDTSVATVDENGQVTGVKAGSIIITVTSNNGKKATCSVTIENSNIGSIKLSKSSLTIAIERRNFINVSRENQEIIWSSSDPNIATVKNYVSSDGKVSQSAEVWGVSAGKAIITAKTKDGSKESKVEITVVPDKLFYKDSLTVAVGSKEYIGTSAFGKEVVWTSSNPSIATVKNYDEDGSTVEITGIKSGTVTITGVTKDGSKKSTCEVTVGEQRVTGISLNKTSLTVHLGSNEILLASVLPRDASNREVIWTSSNTNVATVDITTDSSRVKVNGLKVGTAVITAKTKDGNKVATCEVTVISSYITLNKSEITLLAGSSETLTAVVNPSYAYDKTITWTSQFSNIATVSSSGVVKAIAPGSTTITAKLGSGGGFADCKVTVKRANAWDRVDNYCAAHYYGSNGEMYVNKWLEYNSNRYYFGSDGLPYCSKWLKDGSSMYYLEYNGVMLKNTTKYIDGVAYHFNSSGVCDSGPGC